MATAAGDLQPMSTVRSVTRKLLRGDIKDRGGGVLLNPLTRSLLKAELGGFSLN